VVLAVEGDRVLVYGVNDGPAWQGELRCGLFALAGGYPLDIRQRVSLPANASTLLADFPQAEWSRLGERTHGAFVLLSQDGHSVAQDCLFLPRYQDILWPKADVTVTMRDGAAVFECEVFAWRVCLDLSGEQSLPDNFFDLLPGIPTVLAWPPSLGSPRVLRLGNGEGGASG
jgi:hypothetical protein